MGTKADYESRTIVKKLLLYVFSFYLLYYIVSSQARACLHVYMEAPPT